MLRTRWGIAGNSAKIIGNINIVREKQRFNFKEMSPEQKKNEILQYKESICKSR